MGRADFLSYLRFKSRGNNFHRSSHRIMDRQSRFFWGKGGWLMRWRGYHLRERGETNKTQAHPKASPTNRSGRHGVKYLSLLGEKKAKKREENSRGLIRGLPKKKKWKRGGSRSCFRQSQLIDRRIEWLFLLHFYSSPLHKRHP